MIAAIDRGVAVMTALATLGLAGLVVSVGAWILLRRSRRSPRED